jgi:hypothetical protein
MAPAFVPPAAPPLAPPPGPARSGWVIAPSRKAAKVAETRAERPDDGSWSFGPAAGRAAIGSFLWVLLQYGMFLATNAWVIDSPPDLDAVSGVFGNLAFGLALAIGAVVGIAEKFVPALRLPNGAAYRFVGHNRWGAAALLGAVTGLTIGLGVEFAYLSSKYGGMLGLGPEIPFIAALGFVIAEAAVGRSSRSRREEPSRAM